jgi:hypothetical protein
MKKIKGSIHVLFQMLFWNLLGETQENKKFSVSITGLLTKI